MERLIAIIGPTAVGKTKISIDLAKLLKTEIISGDSMLVYRGLNVGTAKPDLRERAGISHHLIDILEPYEEFSVVEFQQRARKLISDINDRQLIPILAGGTGLYVKALIEDYQFSHANGNEELRGKLASIAKERGNPYLHNILKEVLPEVANRLHPNDVRRVIRALEVYYLGGEKISQNKLPETGLLYDALVLGFNIDRSILYERIHTRVDCMISQGLVEEVANLLNRGVPSESQAMQGIGYKEIVEYLAGQVDLAVAIENIKKATRNFAKRQLTWYRKMPYIEWIDLGKFDEYDKILEIVYNYIAEKYGIG
ncbi:MAG TPA: tRNA (adenosine(37)-N6)-dimethylallyltransferase MiaA [Methylomusa anaerophila]|uniref:tRNA dimethylallyltransferase n=1 Tax=Methylomusa anaerophila TaxID=1930071 RepID=A0A348APU7_9FIRM|nr:tRNA (adenosine(37)-N6)-dimethylallyltransferase MiaA [Methylomusa anaerophila]BBB93095.1 tRNA dimethylallyltransferase [Methylomusa anaerophila]HML87072.1 tRNA (adenosine(37)-N6)-dimethylallyltransferase MiaA [Methylomusa anaerophila]